MPDYGHELAFGTSITPQSRRPQDVVALARLGEEAGLDLVTFQDHPYQPAFLDAWTLLSYVAAQTERVSISGNVLNLPLRQPAMLARAAASLDLLTSGRFELGLGAGVFWEPIEAMGGPNRSQGGAVAALREAIDIVRELWDTSKPGGVYVHGEHYRVHGAKRGPEPAHDIQIWLGARNTPRMLRLIGEKGDGWLPSWEYLEEGDLGQGNARIDEAAENAGRDPREIRRLLNVGPDLASAERLLPLALEDGVSTFILVSDDPRTIWRFAAEVAPALRESVAEERRASDTPSGAVMRGRRALALRRTGIDYDAIPASLVRTAVEPGDRSYDRVRSTYVHTGSPGLVLRPRNVDEVVDALGYARSQDVPLAVRSGGHGIGGRSTNDGGIVIDLGALNAVEIVEGGPRVVLGPGARWGHVADVLAPYGLALTSGDYGDVGVGGLATAGGIGFLARTSGLTIDHVVAAQVVLADGRIVRADAGTNPDLFWALRGAGGNFGIVTAVELVADELPAVVFSTIVLDAADTPSVVERWGAAVEEAPRELTSFLHVFAQRDGAPVAQVVSVYANDDTEAAVAALAALHDLGPVLDTQAQLVPYAAILPAQDAPHFGGAREPLISNGLAAHLTPGLSEALAGGLLGGVTPWVSIRAVGGAVNDVPAEETAYAHRHQQFDVGSVGLREEPFRAHWDELRPHLDGLYTSFETDTRPERLHDAYPGETLTRLLELKRRYDPDNVFDGSFPIEPAVPGRAAA
jgi:alkanesulfonate monooxygenase SsuD/methylene tetrahydromethanopterin reductase-like flavin-dependent oxidoreductase (luciferase family)